MKYISIIFSVIIFIMLANTALLIRADYDLLSTFGVADKKLIFSSERSHIIIFIIYFVVLIASVFFLGKKKYLTSSLISGVVIVFHFIISLFDFGWFV